MFRYAVVLYCLFLGCDYSLHGQGLNNIWLTGYESHVGNPNVGVTKIDFQSGLPMINSNLMEMEFRQTHTNISDSNGNILFYTNGYYIADATNDTMLGGTGINPSTFTSNRSDGLNIPQATIVIPFPDSTNIYVLVHNTIDDILNLRTHYLYYSIIDITKNGGKGEVVLKNQILISDTLNPGKIAAVKHGNGRDWWIICHKLFTNTFYKILLTPNGLSVPDTQSVGIIRPDDNGQLQFSYNGDKLAYYWVEHGIEAFEFDRCTGNLTSIFHTIINTIGGSGVAFSPDGTKLYASATDTLVQFDLNASNILASQTVVAVWDSFYSGVGNILPTWFEYMALAPDGNIYITTGNSTFEYHIIEEPDSLGTACNVIQHGLTLPHLYFNTLPNHPNYHLGPLVGSICDSITGIPPPSEKLTLKLYPNPNNGTFQINYTPVAENLQLQVFNILGEEVHRQLLPQWSQLQNIQINNLPQGVYLATISSILSKKSVKFLVE